MIAYIIVRHYHYDSTEQVEDPSEVWLCREDAERAASRLQRASDTSLYVWEIDLPDEWLKKATLRLSEECGTVPS